MAEFFKAAARCDIAVVRASPIPLNEREIIEEEIRARQWDTVGERMGYEAALRDGLARGQLDAARRRENEERMQRLRLQEKRKEAIQRREVEHQARDVLQRQRQQELEEERLQQVEERRQKMEEERRASKAKAERLAYEEMQRRLEQRLRRRGDDDSGEFSVELPEDAPRSLTYMERMRLAKEGLGRMAQHYDGVSSIKAIYGKEQQQAAAGAGMKAAASLPKSAAADLLGNEKSQLEADIRARQLYERERLRREEEELRAEEQAAEERRQQQERQRQAQRRAEHEAWLAAAEARDAAVRQQKALRDQEQQQRQRPKEHPIDVMHKQVERAFLEEQEAEAMMQENLQYGFSHMEDLEDVIELERRAWREQLQLESEIALENGREGANDNEEWGGGGGDAWGDLSRLPPISLRSANSSRADLR